MAPRADTPKHPDLIYDVGLHKGEDTEFYLRKGFRVVAFEADPGLIATCKEKFKSFIDGGKLTIIEGAIVSPDLIEPGDGKVRFYRNGDVSVWGTVRADWAERNARLGTASSVIEVDAVNFADVIAAHGVPYFMKIDIEGCDAVCLNALNEFVARPSYVSIESDKTSFENIAAEIEMLVDLGYVSFQAVEQSRMRYLSPPNPAREGDYVAQRFEEGSSGLFGAELPGKWKSREDILRLYRFIRVGYFLVGDDGVMKWKFPGARQLRSLTGRVIGLFTRAPVPGWYDTHARHSSAED